MKITEYDKKTNTLYILTDAIMCDLTGLKPRERSQAIRKHFTLSYEERIEKSKYKDQIKAEIKKHPDCIISEYSTL